MRQREAGHGTGKVGTGKTLTSHVRVSVLNVVDGESWTDCTKRSSLGDLCFRMISVL